MARAAPILLLAVLMAAALLLLLAPAWLLTTLAVMVGVLALAGFLAALALLLRPVVLLWHESQDKKAQRAVMMLTAQSQARALRQKALPGKQPSTSRVPAATERTLDAHVSKGRVVALILAGKSTHAIVCELWQTSGGRTYQSAWRYVEYLRHTLPPPAPEPQTLPGARAVFAADTPPAPARTRRTRKQKGE